MNFSQYLDADATALAGAVAAGETTAAELLDLALAQLARVQGAINPVCCSMEAPARERARTRLAGPLAGVPFLLKDGVHDVPGLPTSQGSRALLRFVADRPSAAVRRYLDAGLVIFGKTNLPEFALKGVTAPSAFGRTSNPWNLAHTPGGSSGGASAAIAAGVLPMAAGNDGGGSIRIPAACCGLFGLKPSRGLISSGPGRASDWFGASSEGVISRSVRDTALALDVLHGPEPGDPFVVAAPNAPFVDLMRREPGRLRIGFSTVSPLGTEVHPEAVAAVRAAAQRLLRLGHDVVEAAPAIDGAELARSYLHIYFGQVPAVMARARAAGARDADFEVLTRVIESIGRTVPAGVLTSELEKWNDFGRALGRFHQDHDLYLTPTIAHPPVRHGAGDPPPAQLAVFDFLARSGVLGLLARLGLLAGTVDAISRDSLRYVPFTQLANLTGTPAMSVPLHWTADGLPLGVQFIAPLGREDRLLQLAAQLEADQPWFDRLPAWVREGRAPA
jgi:amidase